MIFYVLMIIRRLMNFQLLTRQHVQLLILLIRFISIFSYEHVLWWLQSDNLCVCYLLDRAKGRGRKLWPKYRKWGQTWKFDRPSCSGKLDRELSILFWPWGWHSILRWLGVVFLSRWWWLPKWGLTVCEKGMVGKFLGVYYLMLL